MAFDPPVQPPAAAPSARRHLPAPVEGAGAGPWLAAAVGVAGGLAAARWLAPKRRKRSPPPARGHRPVRRKVRSSKPQRRKPQRLAISLARKGARAVARAAGATMKGAIVAKVAAKTSASSARPHLVRRAAPPTLPRRLGAAPEQRSWWNLLKQTGRDWSQDKAPRLGAALAYYTVFSIAPLFIIALAVVGFVYGDDQAARAELERQLQQFVGPNGASAIDKMIAAAAKPTTGTVATVLGIVALVAGATGVFIQLKDAMNTIWEVEPIPGRGIWGTIKDRFWSFAMVLAIGFLLLVSLVVSAALSAMGRLMEETLPLPGWIMELLNLGISFAVVTLLFAAIFKLLPDVLMEWRDVWIGAAVTAVLFTIGKYLLGLYIGHSAFASSYGAIGSLLIVLVWSYYSAQILFLGAEFTQVYARMYGSRITPAPNARPVTAESRVQQGMPAR